MKLNLQKETENTYIEKIVSLEKRIQKLDK